MKRGIKGKRGSYKEAKSIQRKHLLKLDKFDVYESFGDLRFKNKKIDFDDSEVVQTLTFQHLYLTSGFMPGAKRTHACFNFGHWCWKQALERPDLAIRYLMSHLK